MVRLLSFVLVLASFAVACGDEERAPDFPGTIAKEVTSDEVNGIQVYVVHPEDPDGVAHGCVDFYREDYTAVSCYVFDSFEAFEAAGTSDEYGKAMKNLCWRAYRSVSATAENGSDDNKRYKTLRCT
jgi:hypothetical protein